MPKFEFKSASDKKAEEVKPHSSPDMKPPSSKGGESIMMKAAKPVEPPGNPFTKPSAISSASSNPFLTAAGKKPQETSSNPFLKPSSGATTSPFAASSSFAKPAAASNAFQSASNSFTNPASTNGFQTQSGNSIFKPATPVSSSPFMVTQSNFENKS